MSITWPPFYCFLLFFIFFTNLLLSAGRMRFLKKKNQVLTKKHVKIVRSITWPHFSENFAKECGQVIDLTILTKKARKQHVKIMKKTIFIVFLSNKEKTAKKENNNFGTCNHNLSCKKSPQVLPLFWGCFLGSFFWLCLA